MKKIIFLVMIFMSQNVFSASVVSSQTYTGTELLGVQFNLGINFTYSDTILPQQQFTSIDQICNAMSYVFESGSSEFVGCDQSTYKLTEIIYDDGSSLYVIEFYVDWLRFGSPTRTKVASRLNEPNFSFWCNNNVCSSDYFNLYGLVDTDYEPDPFDFYYGIDTSTGKYYSIEDACGFAFGFHPLFVERVVQTSDPDVLNCIFKFDDNNGTSQTVVEQINFNESYNENITRSRFYDVSIHLTESFDELLIEHWTTEDLPLAQSICQSQQGGSLFEDESENFSTCLFPNSLPEPQLCLENQEYQAHVMLSTQVPDIFHITVPNNYVPDSIVSVVNCGIKQDTETEKNVIVETTKEFACAVLKIRNSGVLSSAGTNFNQYRKDKNCRNPSMYMCDDGWRLTENGMCQNETDPTQIKKPVYDCEWNETLGTCGRLQVEENILDDGSVEKIYRWKSYREEDGELIENIKHIKETYGPGEVIPNDEDYLNDKTANDWVPGDNPVSVFRDGSFCFNTNGEYVGEAPCDQYSNPGGYDENGDRVVDSFDPVNPEENNNPFDDYAQKQLDEFIFEQYGSDEFSLTEDFFGDLFSETNLEDQMSIDEEKFDFGGGTECPVLDLSFTLPDGSSYSKPLDLSVMCQLAGIIKMIMIGFAFYGAYGIILIGGKK